MKQIKRFCFFFSTFLFVILLRFRNIIQHETAGRHRKLSLFRNLDLVSTSNRNYDFSIRIIL